MIARPSHKHINVVQLEAYAAQLVDVPTETDVEQHLLDCAVCRAALAAVVADGEIAEVTPDRLGTIWTAVAARIDEPPEPAVARPARRFVKRLWDGLRQLLSFAFPATRPFPWARWAAVPIAVAATVLVIMNIDGTAPPSANPSVASAGGSEPATPSGGEASPDPAAPLVVLPGQSAVGGDAGDLASQAVIVPGAPPDARTIGSGPQIRDGRQFPRGMYIAAFLPTVPDGTEVAVKDGRLTIPAARGDLAESDAFAITEARWQQVVEGGLPADILAVGGGNYVVFSGPFQTEQEAKAECDLSALAAAHCVAAQLQSGPENQRSGLAKPV